MAQEQGHLTVQDRDGGRSAFRMVLLVRSGFISFKGIMVKRDATEPRVLIQKNREKASTVFKPRLT